MAKNKQTNEEKIISVMNAMDKSVKILKKHGTKYDAVIDQAALRGDDKMAKALIRRKIGVYKLAEQLEFFKATIELGAVNSAVAASLGTLPEALAGCKGLLSASPDFKRVGKDIEKIFSDMLRPMNEIQKLNDTLDAIMFPTGNIAIGSDLDPVSNEAEDERFKAEYDAMIDRLRPRVEGSSVAAPAVTAESDDTGNFDIDELISGANTRKSDNK